MDSCVVVMSGVAMRGVVVVVVTETAGIAE
jgi:hypothetical protein